MPVKPKLNSLAPATINFWSACAFWLKLGFISFGGPAGQIAIMHQELVEKRRWLSAQRFQHALNYCMLLPGPEAQQLASYLGWLMHGMAGGIIAGVLFVLPSCLILIALAWIYMSYGHVPIIIGMFYGIKPAVTALVLCASYRLGRRVLHNALLWIIAILAFAAVYCNAAPFPLIIGSAALLGGFGGKCWPHLFQTSQPQHSATTHMTPACIIDHNSPLPAHAQFSWRKLLTITGIGLCLWLTAIGGLTVYFGWSHPLTQMGWFFSKAALFTFGGAYAVLPYVYQGMVEHYHWLTAQQMMDGLALGETTPGPLIMVVTFTGFIAGWGQAIFGSEHLLLAGISAALVVTFFSFLPSFIFILAGGPLVESTHGDLKFTAPLTAISAAVTGVILNLALFFAQHVLWPNGISGEIDAVAAIISLLALMTLLRFKWSVIPVIAICGGIGYLLQLAN